MRKLLMRMIAALIAGAAAVAAITFSTLSPTITVAHAWTCNDLVQAALIPQCLRLPPTGPDSQQSLLNEIATSDPTQIRGGAVQNPPAPIPSWNPCFPTGTNSQGQLCTP